MAGTSLEGDVEAGSGEESVTVAGSSGGGEGEEPSAVAGSSSRGGGGEGDMEVEEAAGRASAATAALVEVLMSTEPEAAPPRISEGQPSDDGEVPALGTAHAPPHQRPLLPPGLLHNVDHPPPTTEGRSSALPLSNLTLSRGSPHISPSLTPSSSWTHLPALTGPSALVAGPSAERARASGGALVAGPTAGQGRLMAGQAPLASRDGVTAARGGIRHSASATGGTPSASGDATGMAMMGGGIRHSASTASGLSGTASSRSSRLGGSSSAVPRPESASPKEPACQWLEEMAPKTTTLTLHWLSPPKTVLVVCKLAPKVWGVRFFSAVPPLFPFLSLTPS